MASRGFHCERSRMMWGKSRGEAYAAAEGKGEGLRRGKGGKDARIEGIEPMGDHVSDSFPSRLGMWPRGGQRGTCDSGEASDGSSRGGKGKARKLEAGSREAGGYLAMQGTGRCKVPQRRTFAAQATGHCKVPGEGQNSRAREKPPPPKKVKNRGQIFKPLIPAHDTCARVYA